MITESNIFQYVLHSIQSVKTVQIESFSAVFSLSRTKDDTIFPRNTGKCGPGETQSALGYILRIKCSV